MTDNKETMDSENMECDCSVPTPRCFVDHPNQFPDPEFFDGGPMRDILDDETKCQKIVEDIVEYGLSWWCYTCSGHMDVMYNASENIDGINVTEEGEDTQILNQGKLYGME